MVLDLFLKPEFISLGLQKFIRGMEAFALDRDEAEVHKDLTREYSMHRAEIFFLLRNGLIHSH